MRVARRSPRRRVASAPAMIAPLTADARISAPVLRACIARRPSASSVSAWPGACPAACRSIAWPPTMPAAPAASPIDAQRRAACAPASVGIVVCRLAREQRERLGLQAVAGEDRDAVAVDDVQRRPSAPQRVVVHRRQIVVDQRVGVNQLDARTRRAARMRDRVGVPVAVRPRRRRRASGSGAAACRRRDAVAHRLADDRGAGRRRRQTASRAPRRRARARRSRNAASGVGGRHDGQRRSGSSAGERRRRRLQLAALVEDLDAALGLFEPRMAEARELDAALVERQRLLERRSPSSSFLTIVSSSAIAASKSLMEVSVMCSALVYSVSLAFSVSNPWWTGPRSPARPAPASRESCRPARPPPRRAARRVRSAFQRPRSRGRARRAG